MIEHLLNYWQRIALLETFLYILKTQFVKTEKLSCYKMGQFSHITGKEILSAMWFVILESGAVCQ